MLITLKSDLFYVTVYCGREGVLSETNVCLAHSDSLPLSVPYAQQVSSSVVELQTGRETINPLPCVHHTNLIVIAVVVSAIGVITVLSVLLSRIV